ncbi:acetyltransferase [Caloramator sp. mosi_1]|uniref:acetyltransferase n=1 Tax=Caloramator sp. mosi_1 TaxID=3023090 RepID=UPI00235F93D8|nr:acetyltransferase [Caloramator sp. mosi_1]WDC84201.1 acetyltransferase [Caloramator sp. mosi_1]
MKGNLIIIGASGHGKVVADIASKMGNWNDILFLDDNESTKECLGFRVVGKISEAYKYKEVADFFIAIGKNEVREKIQENLIYEGFNIVSLIHPNAVIGTDVKIGVGTVVMAGAVINSSTKIGKGCIINTNSSVDHDNIIGDYVHISPGANLAGTVTIGKGSWIGIGSSIINNINVISSCKIGAGAVVVNDISEPGTYVGVPARKID